MDDKRQPPSSGPAQHPVLGIALVAVLLAGVAIAVGGNSLAEQAGLAAVALLLLFGLGRAGVFPRALAVAVAVVMGIACLRSDEPWTLLISAGGKAAFYGAFMVAVIALRGPVDQSSAFSRARQALSSRGTARHYPTMLTAAHVLSLVLHMGSISFVGSITHRAGEPRNAKWMGLAALHGFVTTTLWSPLSVAPAIVMSQLAGVNHAIVAGSGFGIAMVVLGGSLVYHRVAGPRGPVDRGGATKALPLRDLGSIGLLIAGIFLLLQVTGSLLHISPMASVVATLPVVIVVWTVVQSRGHRVGGALARLSTIVSARLPLRCDEVLVMILVGLLGPAVSDLLAALPLAQLVAAQNVGTAVILLGAFWVVVLAALAGLNGLVTVVVLMESIPTAQQLGIPAEFLALVFIVAWGLSAASSALSPTTLLVSDAFETRASTVAFDWNRSFSVAVLLAASAGVVIGALCLAG